MWVIVKRLSSTIHSAVIDYFLAIYHSIARLARFSLYLILVGGIPRILAYKNFELANAVAKNQIYGLIVKHIIAFVFVGAGIYLWIKLNKKVKIIKRIIESG